MICINILHDSPSYLNGSKQVLCVQSNRCVVKIENFFFFLIFVSLNLISVPKIIPGFDQGRHLPNQFVKQPWKGAHNLHSTLNKEQRCLICQIYTYICIMMVIFH